MTDGESQSAPLAAHDEPVVQDILTVAMAEFAKLGLAGARVDAIAARTRTSKRMIYYHFGSKERLYAEVLEHAYRVVRNGPVLASLEGLEPLLALATYAGNAFDSFNHCPDFIRLVVQENMLGAQVTRKSKAIADMNHATFNRLKDIVRRGQRDATMRQDITPMNVYTNFIGLCHYNVSSRNAFLALFNYDVTEPANSASRRESICDAIVRYVRA